MKQEGLSKALQCAEQSRVKELYSRRFSKPCSIVVIHPTVESMKIYADAYKHLHDHFVFDETMPICDFEYIPKNVPVLMIGPGDRHGVMADNYDYLTRIKDICYLVRPAYYREYYEGCTGVRFWEWSHKIVDGLAESTVRSSEIIPQRYLEKELSCRQNIIGFWPYSVKWAEWHHLSGVFCGDVILDKQSSYYHGYSFLTDDDMLEEQKRLTEILKSLIKTWPTHSLNLDALEKLEDVDTTISLHNNDQIFVVEKGKIVSKC